MNSYVWDFDVVFRNLAPLLQGFGVTLLLTGATCVIGTMMAVPLALAMRHRNPGVRLPATWLVEFGKGIPLLVLLVWIHYVFPGTFGISTSAFWNAVIAFSISLAAFLGDIIRGGMDSIPAGHLEAALAVGLDRRAVIQRVLIPETVRRSL